MVVVLRNLFPLRILLDLFLHRFTLKRSLSSPATTRRFPGYQQVDGAMGNNPQLLSRAGLVEVNMGKGFWAENL